MKNLFNIQKISMFLSIIIFFTTCSERDNLLENDDNIINPITSPNNPFLIFNEADLRKVGTGIDGWKLYEHYKLMTNITLSNPQADQSNWTPIGSESDDRPHRWGGFSFIGSFDGNGYTITGLTVNNPTGEYQGMFGNVGQNGVIKNLNLTNVFVYGSDYVGSIIGINHGSIENCHITGIVNGNKTEFLNNVGGLVGYNTDTIKNCSFTGNVTNVNGKTSEFSVSGGDAGGIAGVTAFESIIEHCFFIGNVTGGERADTGGVVANNNGIVKNCFASGTFVGGDEVGGVAGENFSIIENCYSTGIVKNGQFNGGIVGSNLGTIKNCYTTCNVIALNSDDISGGVTIGTGFMAAGETAYAVSTGGIAGVTYSDSIIENCYSTGNVQSLPLSLYANGEYNIAITTGGVVGNIPASIPNNNIIKNCVALSPNISNGTEQTTNLSPIINGSLLFYIGRITASIQEPSIVYITNNYGRNDMPITWNKKGLDGFDGIDVTSTQWNSASWWENTVKFPSSVWNFRAGLPTLKNMPGNIEQNPVLLDF